MKTKTIPKRTIRLSLAGVIMAFWILWPQLFANAGDFTIEGSVMYVHRTDGSFVTWYELWIDEDFPGTLPDDITGLTITGPDGQVLYTEDTIEYYPGWSEFWAETNTPPQLGQYTFSVTSNGSTVTVYDTQTATREIPFPDVDFFSPEAGSVIRSQTPTFSWNPVNYDDITIYYRFYIIDSSGSTIYMTDRIADMVSHTIPEDILEPGQTYYWRVRAGDGPDWVAVQNHSTSEWISFGYFTTVPEPPEIYNFERMWPNIPSAWNFNGPSHIAIGSDNNVYIPDRGHHQAQKFSSDGYLIAKWSGAGSIGGSFSSLEGIATGQNAIYIVDAHRVVKYSYAGEILSEWGSYGSGNGQFEHPVGIAIDQDEHVFVVDNSRHRIQKFDENGNFISAWGIQGSGDGEFNKPTGIAIDKGNGFIYIYDAGNLRIQKFTMDGRYILQWNCLDPWSGDWIGPSGIAVDAQGYVYVNDLVDSGIRKYSGEGVLVETIQSLGNIAGLSVDNERNLYLVSGAWNYVQKIYPNGSPYTVWSSAGKQSGFFNQPYDVSVDNNGDVYVSDKKNNRIEKFDTNGNYILTIGQAGSSNGELIFPTAIASDSSNNLYVVDCGNIRIQKFDSDGNFLLKWGSFGQGDGQFYQGVNNDRGSSMMWGIAVDDNFVYVCDAGNYRIQKFTKEGVFVGKWGMEGTGDGQFMFPWAIEVVNNQYVFVTDILNLNIQKFSVDGQFINRWDYSSWASSLGIGNFRGIAVDNEDNLYLSDKDWSNAIYKFSSDEQFANGQYVAQIGSRGSGPGYLAGPQGIDIDATGRVFVVDANNNRIQVFTQVPATNNTKAIIVAGGGPYPGNNLWDATQLATNFAYRTLNNHSFSKESIFYLSADTDLDLDSNGVLDDVDADATNANLQQAIETWAADAENLLIYLVDHGGQNVFRMSGTETLTAADLDTWLDTLQATIPGKVIVIYDACESGSFLSTLTPPSGKDRIVVTSSSPGEPAYFINQGSISFSNYFWTHMFNGHNIKDAFDLAVTALGFTTDHQNPMLDDNGNGSEDAGDGTLAANTWIGIGRVIHGDSPQIGSVSGAQTIDGTPAAVLTASNVTDNDGIARVWAVIRPPNFSQGPPDNPVQDLPSLDLLPVGNGQYKATYTGFDIEGTYQIAIYARDRIGNTSIPELTTVSVSNPQSRKAVIVAADIQTHPLRTAIQNSVQLAYQVLRHQGYTDNDIYYLNPITATGVDTVPTLTNLDFVVNNWAQQGTQDVVIYLVGRGESGTFQLNETETLLATDLDTWLDILQSTIPGKATVVYDADQSGSFLPYLTPPEDKQRIVISGSDGSQPANFIADGDISFSKFFWRGVLNGMNVRDSFIHAKNAMWYCSGQSPQLDDNGNGSANEKDDGRLAENYSIGVGIMLAGDDPVIGSVSPPQTLNGSTSTSIWAEGITTTGTIDSVWAVITPPVYHNPDIESQTVELLDGDQDGRYEGTVEAIEFYGTYTVGIYAMDTAGNLSLPAETTIIQQSGPDIHEDDDTFNTAKIVIVNHEAVQDHNFHDQADTDWTRFYAVAGQSYTVKADNVGSQCDPALVIYAPDGTTALTDPAIVGDDGDYGEGEQFSWPCPADGIYYVKTTQNDSTNYGQNTGYDFQVYQPIAGLGSIVGRVADLGGHGISDALVRSDIGNAAALCTSNGYYILNVVAGTHALTVTADAFHPLDRGDVVLQESAQYNIPDIVLTALPVTGDINADGRVDLTDAVIAMKVLAGVDMAGEIRSNYVGSGVDVNGDQKIGNGELIYILEVIPVLR